jgi:hypothetical protein
VEREGGRLEARQVGLERDLLGAGQPREEDDEREGPEHYTTPSRFSRATSSGA